MLKPFLREVPDHCNLSVLHRRCLPARAWFIPASGYDECSSYEPVEAVERSSRCRLLSGVWQFRYYASPLFVEEAAVAEQNGLKWKDVPVPSCWQTLGYEPPFYVNNDFIFPADPPHVPRFTPVGVYRREFCVNVPGKRVIITFLGVAAGFTLFVNGAEAGYSQGSHNMSEFDVTELVRPGKNVLAVLVYKWCDGSYLESQDMFRYNGIFRDVYLTYAEPDGLVDFAFRRTPAEGNRWRCTVSGATRAAVSVRIRLAEDGKVIRELTVPSNGTFSADFAMDAPRLWSAERPETYRLYLSVMRGGTEAECACHTVGFKHIDYAGPAFRINGVPIKIKGVNHHDTSIRGYCMSVEEYRRDALLMKEYNVNTVRTSHYPPDPRFLELCDTLGLYVIDEADLESYGSLNMADIDYFGKNSDWRPAFLDRMERLYMRDRSRACVIMWSMGNEAGVGENFDAAYRYLTNFNSGIPVQYETCFRDWQYDEPGYDIVSLMYPDMEKIEEWMQKADNRPFYLCEYCHAMGLGPGGLKEYWKKVYRYEKFIGGCIWEWADHAAYHERAPKYTYGGDHGEYVHDGNFCCDGMFYPDREPSTSALEVKNVYRPLRFAAQASPSGAQLTCRNTMSFTDAAECSVRYSVLENGAEIAGGELPVSAPPLLSWSGAISFPRRAGQEYAVNVFTYDAGGRLCGTDSILLEQVLLPPPRPEASACRLKENERALSLCRGNSRIVFDKRTCTICSWQADGVELFNQRPTNDGYGAHAKRVRGIYPNIWRPLADNDIRYAEEWNKHLYQNLWTDYRVLTVERKENCVTVFAEGILSPPKYDLKFRFGARYTLHFDLTVDVEYTLIPQRDGLPYLPKFGLMFEMPEHVRRVEWYGRGQAENYPDMQEAARWGVFQSEIFALRDNHVLPQESGARCGVRWARFVSDAGASLTVYQNGAPFSFNASHYPMRMVERARHREDLRVMPTTEVHIDGFLSGIGSNACGPLPFEAYRVVPEQGKPLTFSCRMKAEGRA